MIQHEVRSVRYLFVYLPVFKAVLCPKTTLKFWNVPLRHFTRAFLTSHSGSIRANASNSSPTSNCLSAKLAKSFISLQLFLVQVLANSVSTNLLSNGYGGRFRYKTSNVKLYCYQYN